MTSKKGSFLIPSKMQKELQCVGSGLALDELMEASEMSVKLQETFICETFHGKSDDSNSIHLQTQFWHPAIAMSFCTHSSAICIPSYGKFMVQLWHIFA
jgi:hypothetical protein